jgi:hypothetical protein
MDGDDKFRDLVTRAHDYLTGRQEELRQRFSLHSWPRWDWNQDSGQLVFSADGVPKVIADIQFVGSVSSSTGTWLWSWANPWFDERWTKDVRDVRLFGEAHGVWQLTTAKWEADEVDGWEMTSITAYVLQAKGAYRTPGEAGLTYMVMSDVRWAEDRDA